MNSLHDSLHVTTRLAAISLAYARTQKSRDVIIVTLTSSNGVHRIGKFVEPSHVGISSSNIWVIMWQTPSPQILTIALTLFIDNILFTACTRFVVISTTVYQLFTFFLWTIRTYISEFSLSLQLMCCFISIVLNNKVDGQRRSYVKQNKHHRMLACQKSHF